MTIYAWREGEKLHGLVATARRAKLMRLDPDELLVLDEKTKSYRPASGWEIYRVKQEILNQQDRQ